MGYSPTPLIYARDAISESCGIGLLDNAVGNQLSGVNPGEANVIANNLWAAVQLCDTTSTNNAIRGNSSFANSADGIALYTG